MSGRKTNQETDKGQARGSASRKAANRSRVFLFRCAAVLTALLPFVLAERGLRGFDRFRPTNVSDPLSGFNRDFPLFERQGNVYRMARNREPFFSPQEFPVTKPRNGFRVFCFGGSTVHGHPYEADTAFPKWLELELNGCDPAHTYQVINCGGVSYASYRLTPLVKEVLQYQPDLIILATGHNEFLEDRTYQALKKRPAVWAWLQNAAYSLRIVSFARQCLAELAALTGQEIRPDRITGLSLEVRTRLDAASGYASYHRDDAWRENVIAQFDESVREIVSDCHAVGVPIILVRLGSNLRDCPPFKSEHRADLPPGAERAWQIAFDTATLADQSDPEHALELYRKAEAIDGEYALLDYRIARIQDRLGRMTNALTCYLKARDEDVCPLRIITPMERSLGRIAVQSGTPLLDAARLLSAESLDFNPGFDWYLDHVHPTIGGHQKIAQAIAALMREAGWWQPDIRWTEAKRRETYAHHLQQLGPIYFSEAKERVAFLENWARRQRLFSETLPQDAHGYVRLGFRQLDLGDGRAAWQSFAQALRSDAGTAELLRERAQELISRFFTGHSG